MFDVPPRPPGGGAHIVKLNVSGVLKMFFWDVWDFPKKFLCSLLFWQNVIVKLKRPIVKLKRPF